MRGQHAGPTSNTANANVVVGGIVIVLLALAAVVIILAVG
jgi:hypothetical protein